MYNEKTIINNQEINLTKEEQENVAKFHKSRIAFAVIFNEDNTYTLALNKRDEREHRVYLKEDFGITDEVFETLLRGYIKEGKIIFYITSYFKSVKQDLITKELINELLNVAKEEFGSGKYNIGNGLAVGLPGKEEWSPMQIIDTYIIE